MVSRQPNYVMHSPVAKGILDFKDIDGLSCCLVQQYFRFKISVTLDLRAFYIIRSKHLTLCAKLSVTACSIHFNVTFKITVAHRVFFVVMWPR